ncbi:MAG: hypothetical protein JWO38_1076 [Gemmataceae bacterium]|nr:hypothetical protein [Gemmataceae bacterium]
MPLNSKSEINPSSIIRIVTENPNIDRISLGLNESLPVSVIVSDFEFRDSGFEARAIGGGPVVRAVVALLVAVVVVVATGPGRASLYQPEDPMTVPVGPDGAGPLPFDEFKRRLVSLTNAANPKLKDENGRNSDRERVLARVKARQLARDLPADATAALAGDMLLLGNTDPAGEADPGLYVNKALDLLIRRSRERAPNYFVFTTLAQAHAARGEWAEAVTYHDAALIDCEMPAKVKGWTDAQRDWLAKLDQTYVPHYLRIRKAEAEGRPRPAPETEDPTPLFPLPGKDQPAAPVRFVTDAGGYEPGALAEAEAAKFPPDAGAIVQQLLLWFPSDTRLYWLLAELYAVDGQFGAAQKIMDECVGGRQYGNRKALMEHRGAVTTAAEAQRKAAEQAAEAAVPLSLHMVWVYFAVVALVGVFAAVRAVGRRRRGGCGRGGGH